MVAKTLAATIAATLAKQVFTAQIITVEGNVEHVERAFQLLLGRALTAI